MHQMITVLVTVNPEEKACCGIPNRVHPPCSKRDGKRKREMERDRRERQRANKEREIVRRSERQKWGETKRAR